MLEIGPLPEPLNSSPVDLSKHWSILDQTKAEFKASGRSGVVIYVEPDEAYRAKLTAFLAKFNTKMDLTKPNMKPYLVIELGKTSKLDTSPKLGSRNNARILWSTILNPFRTKPINS